MRVEIELQPGLSEPYVKIFTKEINPQVQTLFQQVMSFGERKDFLLLWDKEKYQVVRFKDIQMIRYEERQVIFYTDKQKYFSSQHLYQVEQKLIEPFLRISKTTIVNMNYVESVEPSFNSTMTIHLSNNLKDYISRKYLPDFKKYLGL